MKSGDKVSTAVCVILIVLIVPLLIANSIILIKSYMFPAEVPGLFGYKPFVVLSGSMETEIYTGDLAIVEEIDTNNLVVDDIIAFRVDDIIVVHRIVDIKLENGVKKYITKGDNNDFQDDGTVLSEDIEGRYLCKISKIGNFVMFLQQPTGLIIAISIPVIMIALVQISSNKQYKKEIENLKKDSKE